jgi:hypothetical protein
MDIPTIQTITNYCFYIDEGERGASHIIGSRVVIVVVGIVTALLGAENRSDRF